MPLNKAPHKNFLLTPLPRTTLFQENAICQISLDQKLGKPELTQMQHEQNGCEKLYNGRF